MGFFWAAAMICAGIGWPPAATAAGGSRTPATLARPPVQLPRTASWPRPRPAAAAATTTALPQVAAPSAAPSAAPVPEIAACLQRLSEQIAIIKPLPPIAGPNGCGANNAIRLAAVVTRTGRQVALQPPADLQCSMAEQVVRWVRDDLVPLAKFGESPLSAVVTAASYDCRGRNRVTGAKLSQHGLANALDVSALKFADGKIVTLTDRAVAKELRLAARETACARFNTVLGPDSDGYHEQHIHLDLIQRRGGYRLCQWAVHDPGPASAAPGVAIPMPRPAPRRASVHP